MPPPKTYILVAYHPDTGEIDGYLTDRSTMTSNRDKAVHYQYEGLANGKCEYLEVAPGWSGYIWVVEEVVTKPYR